MARVDVDYLRGAAGRVAAAAEACTRCGACFDVCPMPAPAGIGDAEGPAVVEGLLGLLAGRPATAEAAAWTGACCGSGYCSRACPEGLDVRFLQRMGKLALQAEREDPKELRRRSVQGYNAMAASARAISALLAEPEDLARLGDGRSRPGTAEVEEPPADVTFYTGCNVWKTPHIVMTALDALEAVGVSAKVMGGAAMCCGVYAFNGGDGKVSGRQAFGTVEKLGGAATELTLSWCPSCQIQIGDLALGNWEAETGERPFEMAPFYGFLAARIGVLAPQFRPVPPRRVALIERPAIPGAMEAVRILLAAVPGVELVELTVRPAGVMESTLASLKDFRDARRADILAEAEAAGVDVLATVYHGCHRELCRYDDGRPFEILNVMSLLAEALGRPREDRYKALAATGSVDAAIEAAAPDAAARGIDLDQLRAALRSDMFKEPA